MTYYIPTDPNYYGPDATPEDGRAIAEELARLVREEFAEQLDASEVTVEVRGWTIGHPTSTLLSKIDAFVERNWVEVAGRVANR